MKLLRHDEARGVDEAADERGKPNGERLREYRDERLWDVDRMHMSAAGHQRMAIAVLDALRSGVLGLGPYAERFEAA